MLYQCPKTDKDTLDKETALCQECRPVVRSYEIVAHGIGRRDAAPVEGKEETYLTRVVCLRSWLEQQWRNRSMVLCVSVMNVTAGIWDELLVSLGCPDFSSTRLFIQMRNHQRAYRLGGSVKCKRSDETT